MSDETPIYWAIVEARDYKPRDRFPYDPCAEVSGCPTCSRTDHSNHMIWLLSDNFDGEIGPTTIPLPYPHPPEDVKPGDTVNVVPGSRADRPECLVIRDSLNELGKP